MNIQTKIYLTLVVWLCLLGAMFGYGFGILQNSNSESLVSISQEKDQLLSLQAEQQSYLLAQRDLEDLSEKEIQPKDFFSKDTTLVREITALENLGKINQVTLNIAGISGTIDSLPKAKTISPLFVMPYSMTVTGSINNVLNFVESLYNLDFITTINSFTLGAANKNTLNVNLTANFYLRK